MALSRAEKLRLLQGGDSDPDLGLGEPDPDPGQLSREQKLALLKESDPPESMGRALFPSTSAALDRGAGVAGKAAGVLSDLASGVLRLPAAAGRTMDTKMGLSGSGPQSFRESLSQINRGEDARGEEAFIPKVVKDPATVAAAAMAPLTGPIALGARGARLLPAIGRLAGAGAIEGAVSGAAHNVDEFARTGSASPGAIPTEAAIGGALGPIAGAVGAGLGYGARALRGLGRGAQEILPATPLRGAPAGNAIREGLEEVAPGNIPPQLTRQGITLTPSQVAGETRGLRPAIEQYAQSNPFLNDIPGQIADANQAAIPRSVLGQRNQLRNPIGDVGDVTPSAIGGRIDEAARAAKRGLGESFGQMEDEAMAASGVGRQPLPTHYAPKRGEGGKFTKNQVQDVLRDIDSYVGEHGFNPAKGFTGQENGLSRQAFAFVEEQKALLANTKTTRDLLNQQRRIGREIYDGKVGDVPVFRDRDVVFLEGFERKINEAVERQFDLIVGEGPGQLPNNVALAAKNLWNSQKLSYSQNRRLLEAVDQKLGVSSGKTNVEQYFNRIKNIGVENLEALRQAAQQSEAINPLYQELQSGFFDNLLKASTSKAPDGTLTLSPEKLVTQWRTMDAGLKRAMVPEGVIGEMDELVEVVARSRTNQAALTNPSGTARLLNLTQAVKNPQEWIQGLLMRGPIREYYRSGNIMPAESILNVLHRTGRAAETTGRALEGGLNAGRTLGGNPLSRQLTRSTLSGAYENDR
jgi:hypothetical protein